MNCVVRRFSLATRSLSLLLTLLIAAIIMPMTGADIPRPRGVSLAHASLYQPRADHTWSCLDGSSTIRFEQVNDDYCDCADGSDEPGTSACMRGRFHCANVGHKAQDIPSSRVNDGICDCCDGSDEWNVPEAKCIDTCQALGRAAEEQRRSEAELHQRGSARRSELISKGKQMRAEREVRRQELERRRSEQEALKAEKDMLKRQAEAAEAEALELYKEQHQEQEAGQPITGDRGQEVYVQAQEAFIQYDVNQDGFVEVTELQVDMKLDKDGDGVVSVQEAKYYLDERDRMDLDSFIELSWPRLMPQFMTAQGLFKPPTEENLKDPMGEVEADNIVEGGEGQKNEENEHVDVHAETGDEGEEELDEEGYEEDDGDADVGVGSVTSDTSPPPEYDPETQRLIDLANQARSAYADVEREIRDIEHEIKDIDEQENKDYGPHDEYAAMDGECYSFEDREYVYTLCPFERAAQKQRSGGAETTLGRWDKWLGEGENKYAKQLYAHGASCWNGPQRSAVVELKCALDHKITSVTEPNRCEYHYVFETPAACSGLVDDDKRGHDEL